MNINKLKELLAIVDNDNLKQWILNYSQTNADFAKELMDSLNPKTAESTEFKNYPELIRSIFYNHPVKLGNRYRGYDYDGFEAEDVRADLEEVLNDVGYFLAHQNIKAAVHICKCMIEIIPEEWDPQFDYDGDVQVMYDEAINYLENMLEENLLTSEEKQDLFDWYVTENEDAEKHEYIGLNTDLSVLQQYFYSPEEIREENLKSVNIKIAASKNEYEKEQLIIHKSEILKEGGRLTERESLIEEFLNYEGVKKLKLKNLLEKKAYSEAILLIKEGIQIAENEKRSASVVDWKDELLRIYQIQNDHSKIVALAEELFYVGRNREDYYMLLKSETPIKEWPETVERIIKKTADRGYFGFDYVKAKILIEHEKWELLFNQCKVGNTITYFEEYERYLRPLFDKDLLEIYVKYVGREATNPDQQSYENVARILKRLKKFPGGKEKVKELVTAFREVYKRRPNMMKALEGI